MLNCIHNVAMLIILINITRISSPSKLSCLHVMHCYDLLHLILVFAVGEILRDKLIRCHRTELIRAATFACMGRPWSGYRSAFYGYHQVGEVMHARYPGPVGGDNLEIHSV